jgi:hypothetical protein
MLARPDWVDPSRASGEEDRREGQQKRQALGPADF